MVFSSPVNIRYRSGILAMAAKAPSILASGLWSPPKQSIIILIICFVCFCRFKEPLQSRHCEEERRSNPKALRLEGENPPDSSLRGGTTKQSTCRFLWIAALRKAPLAMTAIGPLLLTPHSSLPTSSHSTYKASPSSHQTVSTGSGWHSSLPNSGWCRHTAPRDAGASSSGWPTR